MDGEGLVRPHPWLKSHGQVAGTEGVGLFFFEGVATGCTCVDSPAHCAYGSTNWTQ